MIYGIPLCTGEICTSDMCHKYTKVLCRLKTYSVYPHCGALSPNRKHRQGLMRDSMYRDIP